MFFLKHQDYYEVFLPVYILHKLLFQPHGDLITDSNKRLFFLNKINISSSLISNGSVFVDLLLLIACSRYKPPLIASCPTQAVKDFSGS